jgi:hypothetical protein
MTTTFPASRSVSATGLATFSAPPIALASSETKWAPWPGA